MQTLWQSDDTHIPVFIKGFSWGEKQVILGILQTLTARKIFSSAMTSPELLKIKQTETCSGGF